ncbi:MAG: transcriptional repressor [Candidatus Omnitrophica bacterium]|nr:transcriptional repressor [Candidatus Omnitrophota bacterium]
MSHSQQPPSELVYFPHHPNGRTHYAQRMVLRFEQALHTKGLRVTPERRAILDALLGADRHLTIEQIFAQARRRAPALGRATMFRMLKLLRETNLITRVAHADDQYYYEVGYERPHHDHLVCIRCRKIIEIRWPELERIQSAGCRRVGFVPVWHRHELFGYCRHCAPKGGRRR